MQDEKITVKVENIHKYYEKDKIILQDINLIVKKKEIISILGTSGSGKSTLLSLIGLLDKANKGRISFPCIKRKYNHDEIRLKHIGFIYQSHCLLRNFTILENIMLPALLKGDNIRTAQSNSALLLKQVGIYDKKDNFFYQLSEGQCQRASIVRSIINKPNLILADEPTGNLDKKNSLIVFNMLKTIVLDNDSSCILLTHDQDLAKLSSSCYQLHNGMLIKKI